MNILKSEYIKTQKNEQVKEFFDRCSFDLIDEDGSVRNYTLSINTYVPFKSNYIEVINGNKSGRPYKKCDVSSI